MKKIKIYFIVGLSGSGKSTLVRKKFAEYIKEYDDGVSMQIIDDYGSNLSKFLSFDILKRSQTEMNILFISSHMLTSKKILDDSENLLKESFKDFKHIEVEKIFFKNDFPQCCKNLIWRDGIDNTYRMSTINYRLSRSYNPPHNAIDVARADNDEEVKKKLPKKIRNFSYDWERVEDNDYEKEKVLNYYIHILDRAKSLYCTNLIDNKKRSK